MKTKLSHQIQSRNYMEISMINKSMKNVYGYFAWNAVEGVKRKITEYYLPSSVTRVSLSVNEWVWTHGSALWLNSPAQISRYSARSTASRSKRSVEWPNYRDLCMAAWLCTFSVPATCGGVLFPKSVLYKLQICKYLATFTKIADIFQ